MEEQQEDDNDHFFSATVLQSTFFIKRIATQIHRRQAMACQTNEGGNKRTGRKGRPRNTDSNYMATFCDQKVPRDDSRVNLAEIQRPTSSRMHDNNQARIVANLSKT